MEAKGQDLPEEREGNKLERNQKSGEYLAKENTEKKTKRAKRFQRETNLKKKNSVVDWQLCLSFCAGWVLST